MKTEAFRDIAYSKDVDTGIVTVTLNTPGRKNALSGYSFLEFYFIKNCFSLFLKCVYATVAG